MTQQVIIHCKPSLLQTIQDLGLEYYNCGSEIDVHVDDVAYTVNGAVYQDPDEQFCEHYGIDYDQVNMIELA